MDFEGKLADLKAVMTKLKKSDFISPHFKKVFGISSHDTDEK